MQFFKSNKPMLDTHAELVSHTTLSIFSISNPITSIESCSSRRLIFTGTAAGSILVFFPNPKNIQQETTSLTLSTDKKDKKNNALSSCSSKQTKEKLPSIDMESQEHKYSFAFFPLCSMTFSEAVRSLYFDEKQNELVAVIGDLGIRVFDLDDLFAENDEEKVVEKYFFPTSYYSKSKVSLEGKLEVPYCVQESSGRSMKKSFMTKHTMYSFNKAHSYSSCIESSIIQNKNVILLVNKNSNSILYFNKNIYMKRILEFSDSESGTEEEQEEKKNTSVLIPYRKRLNISMRRESAVLDFDGKHILTLTYRDDGFNINILRLKFDDIEKHNKMLPLIEMDVEEDQERRIEIVTKIIASDNSWRSYFNLQRPQNVRISGNYIAYVLNRRKINLQILDKSVVSPVASFETKNNIVLLEFISSFLLITLDIKGICQVLLLNKTELEVVYSVQLDSTKCQFIFKIPYFFKLLTEVNEDATLEQLQSRLYLDFVYSDDAGLHLASLKLF
eukprot:snap_masked-scaffold_16-processed-gene-1.29-mRNA-1 protein AED:1.00 eAED:1.00 QI:0/-1/0/0/-1/1/1/0/501